MTISSEVFKDYLKCQYKAYLKTLGKSGVKTDYENLHDELRKEFELRAKDLIITKYKVSDYIETDLITFSDLAKGKDAIFNTRIEYSDLDTDFDVLLKISGDSVLGSFHYVPILFCSNNRIYKRHKILISFQAYIIGSVQKRMPHYAQIVYGQKQQTTRVTVDAQLQNVHKIIQGVREQQNGKTAPQIILNSHCAVCEYKDLCRNIAEEDDNLSMLSGISEREIKRQNNKGIFTITQYSYTFRPRKRSKRVKNKHIIHYGALKALAIRENKIYIYEKFELPSRQLEIYLDVEGDPEQGYDYLVGLLIVQHDATQYHSFWANSRQDEEIMFTQFLRRIEECSEYHLFHYGSYEVSFLKRMSGMFDQKYKKQVDEILSKCVDVFAIIHSHIYLPTYSNGLKDIACYLGFEWTSSNASGIQSLAWRKIWELTGDDSIKQNLLLYNNEDCLALQMLTNFIYRIPSEPNENDIDGKIITYANKVVRDTDYRFKKQEFVYPDLDYINKCSYFNYQRDKVYVRTNGNLRRIQKQEKRKAKHRNKINKYIVVESQKCPNCEYGFLYKHKHSKFKDLLDLRFSSK